jgi:hypothetical protein
MTGIDKHVYPYELRITKLYSQERRDIQPYVEALREEVERLTEVARLAEMQNDQSRSAIGELTTEIERLTAEKDGAYLERNRVVAALASLARRLGWEAGTARTAIEGWSPEWHGCVYVDTPQGQLSWHYHDDQGGLFAHLPAYSRKWDGHTTPEKYERLAALAAGEETK